MGISGCFLTCFDESVPDDLGQPCQNMLSCCSCTGRMCADCHTRRTGTTYICVDCNMCSESCSNTTCECCSENHSCTECGCGNCFGGEVFWLLQWLDREFGSGTTTYLRKEY